MGEESGSAAVAAPSTSQANTNTGPSNNLEDRYRNSFTDGADSAKPPGQNSSEPTTTEEFEEIEAYGKKHKLNKEQLRKMAQKGLGADSAFKQAKVDRDQAAQILRAIQENPLEVLKHLHGGDKLRGMMEDYVYENLKADQMSPEEKKHLADQQRLRDYEEKDKKIKEADFNRQQEEAVEYHKIQYTQNIIKSLDHAKVGRNEEAARRALGYYQKAYDKGVKIDPQTVGELVKEDYEKEIRNNTSEMDGESLITMLGEEAIEKIRKALLTQHQQRNYGFMPPARQPEAREQPQGRHYITEDEWNDAKRR